MPETIEPCCARQHTRCELVLVRVSLPTFIAIPADRNEICAAEAMRKLHS
jgi:hypothetical protein